MSFLKKLFGGGKKEVSYYNEFKEGDVFYTQRNGKYQVFKLLRIDLKSTTFHVMSFSETNHIPKLEELSDLKVFVHHAPISSDGFSNSQFIANTGINERDLAGYFEYIKQTNNIDEIVKYASEYYRQGHSLSTQNKHKEAIQKYSTAIDLMPNYYEAIDNRAFVFMDMGMWAEAIEGFNQSLLVNPNSLLAIFSIGECHLRLKQFSEAKSCFDKAIQIDPSHPKPKEFLALTIKLMNE